MPGSRHALTETKGTTKIALLIGEAASYSDQCLRLALEKLYCQVDYLSLAKPSPNATTKNHALALHNPEQLKAYALIIYPYLENRHEEDFAKLSAWLEHYQQHEQGRVLIRYHAGVPLHNLRAYNATAPRVRQLELSRQALSEWVQKNARHFFWSATSDTAAHDLAQWGVARHPEHMAIAPPYTSLHGGAYAEQTQKQRGQTKVLIVGDYLPDTGHPLLLDVLANYRQHYEQTITFHFIGTDIEGLAVYRESLHKQIARLELGDSALLSHTHAALSHTACLALSLEADLALSIAQEGRYLPEHIQVQATGLPSLSLEADISPREGASLLHQLTGDDTLRRQAVIAAYRHIAQHYSHNGIEQALLSHVLSALCR